MEEINSRSSLRDRILTDLKSIVKQIYHESVNNELGPENKTYICLTLIKHIDEALRHGLKQLHLGYWKPVSKIIHPEMLQTVDNLPSYNNDIECNGLAKGKAWVALSLKDESFINYIQCLVTEGCLEKYYEDWSILRTNDSCNTFLSVLSGLENVLFSFDVEYVNKSPTSCILGTKISCDKKVGVLNLNESRSSMDLGTSSSSLTSPVDSGVHIPDSSSDLENKEVDIDFLNGNISETVLLRKQKKNAKRHVSFHEDIIYKSPEKCRKLKWDSENLRYSWSGEEIDSAVLKESDFSEIKLQGHNKCSTPYKGYEMTERGAPEGEETPLEVELTQQQHKSQKPIMVKRFLQSIRNQQRPKHHCKSLNCTKCNFKLLKVDLNLISEINDEIKKEMECRPKNTTTKYEVNTNAAMMKEMIRNQLIYKSYRLQDYLFIITNCNLYLINRNLEMKRIHFRNLKRVIVYPDLHVFKIIESDIDSDNEVEENLFITGNAELTNEVLGRLEYSMRRNQFDLPHFCHLDHSYFSFVKKSLVEQLALGRNENFLYCGAINLYKENDLLNIVLPSSKRGFLMYRHIQASELWIPGDFYMKNGILYLYGDDTSLPKFAINVATGCQSCNRTRNPDRPHTFQITLMENEFESHQNSTSCAENNSVKSKSHSKKIFSSLRQKMNKILTLGNAKESCSVLEFAAANEYELSEWLQMIIQASCGDSCEEAHKDDLLKGMLWVTENSLLITNEVWSSTSDEIEIVSCAQLRDVAAIKIGECDKDFFIVIEFICMEASSTSGDWILYMSSRDELNKLIGILNELWKFNEQFPIIKLKEGRLMTRCRKSQESLSENVWAPLLR
ncbi:hypothetical protein RUM43_014418 [Polyplax serrata]|uniref:RUN domain-containing protein n=1 Tax=Polyplax serrata TaxID=468196 RepID=A0AAN8NQI3_POLSC